MTKRKHPERLKKTKKKLQSIRNLRKKARIVFAKWIVKRDNGICFTCGKPGNQAGHAIHRNCFDFCEELNRCQCPRCNLWLHGNIGVYTRKLITIYGCEQMEKWENMSHDTVKFDREYLEGIIKKYG